MAGEKEKIRSLYDQAFPEKPEWNKWFFEKVYNEDDGMLLVDNGNPVSSLIMQKYVFSYHGSQIGLSYISGVATAPKLRGRGYMSRLITDALHTAYARGDVLSALIPASRALFFFYDRFGFVTAVYADIERYTSVHVFESHKGYIPVEADYRILSSLEQLRSATVLHSETDFRHIIEDVHNDGGDAFAVCREDDGSPAAILFAVPTGHEIHVLEKLAIDEDAAETAFAMVRQRYGCKSLTVWSEPGGRKIRLRALAMMRIINVGEILTCLAKRYPTLDLTLRVHDAIIPQNNGAYILHGGKCEKSDYTMRRLSLDIDISTLTSLLFSDRKIGEIFSLPTARAMLPLMLD
ncbi:MAG: GNAT family N-acetyltransferase [Bacteroidales bacterium]|nr:GNAT family N-acetyltransferase [Bacteroidales bacterium]